MTFSEGVETSLPDGPKKVPLIIPTETRTVRRQPWRTRTSIAAMGSVVLLASSLLLVACSSSTNDSAPPDDDPAGTPPTAPAELKGVVYTETEIEIFWESAEDDVQVTGYDVARNGTPLATNLDARSYYDNTVAAATNYTYRVMAVDNEGTRGPAISIEFITPEQLPTLRQSNYFLVVGQIFDFYTQAAYDERVRQADHQDVETTTIRNYPLYYYNASYAYYTEYDCLNGGLATNRGSPVSCSGRCRSTTRIYYVCEVYGEIFTGRVDTDSDYFSNSLSFNELTMTREDERSVIMSGRLAGRQLGGKIDSAYERRAMVSRYESPDIQGATVVTDVDTVFSYGSVGTGISASEASARLAGSLTLRSPVTGNKSVTVTTPIEFVNNTSEDRRFPTGTLQILADDGSQLNLNADNGDPDSLTVTLTIDGSSSTFTEPWDTWIDQLSR